MPKKSKSIHPLDILAADRERAMMLAIWKMRFYNPELCFHIREEDIVAFEQSLGHTNQQPVLEILRAPGTPAQDEIPAMPPSKARPQGSPAQPARPAGPARDFVVVQLVDEQGNLIVPVENNEKDYEKGRDVARVRQLKSNAGDLANRIANMIVNGTYSDDELREAVASLKAFAQA